MEFSVLAFGIAKDIIGKSILEIELMDPCTTDDLRKKLVELYPDFNELVKFSIAINNEYSRGDQALSPGDEIAIIPPVSGG